MLTINSNPVSFLDLNGIRIDFPSRDMTLAQAIRALTPRFPQLRHTHVYPEDCVPVMVDGELQHKYPVLLAPPKTNG
ncbi:hypothetical protein [Motilimonas eburnea]|uniref:hypothetical protein n=1 Tax=Motilimonas eburnea TaxID=1737488 RepID=UPI001E52BD2F|nr:hypothetical protein [Motilimonas eburnea]MCE2571717.1 hypothetical protein [Motilimonas eburnea]